MASSSLSRCVVYLLAQVHLLIYAKLQAPKKDKKDEDEEDLAFKKRKQEEAAATKAAKDKGS